MWVEWLETRHLKGSEGQVKEYFIILGDGLAEGNKNHIMDPEQRNQQQGGFSQPPGERQTNSNLFVAPFTWTRRMTVHGCFHCKGSENILSVVWRLQYIIYVQSYRNV